jgi:uncharacterized protein DUF1687
LIHPSQPKTLDIITLFHKPSLPTSMRVLNLLKQASAAAGETATMDQASNGNNNNNTEEKQRGEFELEVTEASPTPDQLRNILDYVAPRGVKPGDVIRGARDRADALKKLKEGQEDDLVRPVVSLLSFLYIFILFFSFVASVLQTGFFSTYLELTIGMMI